MVVAIAACLVKGEQMTHPDYRPKVFAPAAAEHLGGTIGHGDYPNAVLQASTANFRIYVDASVGAALLRSAVARFAAHDCSVAPVAARRPAM